jgi:glycosyltransferase involved in cell wall biosynthesis
MSRRVLFANHTSELAGAERQVLDTIQALGGAVDPLLACPAGELLEAAGSRGIPVAQIPGTTVSLRPHPTQTARGLAQIATSAVRLRRLARAHHAVLIHANTERAGLAAALAARAGGPPLVAHAHTRLPAGRLAAATARALARGARIVIANSNYTAEPLRARGATVEVAHNPIDTGHFDPATVSRATARASLGLAEGDLALAVIGYLAPVKRQDDAIRVLAQVRKTESRARLVIAGSTRFTAAGAREDSVGYARGLGELAAELGVAEDVVFAGERDDVREVLAAADVVLVPSLWEGFGRVVLESMAMAVPVIATNVGGPAEIVRDGVDGVLLAPDDPSTLANATSTLLSAPELRHELGVHARERARIDFSPDAFRGAVLAAYERALAA